MSSSATDVELAFASGRGKVAFFPALNSLRFIAASTVVLHHMELNKLRCGMPGLLSIYTLEMLGKQGVHLFFVLSSFLLTYLLLSEAKSTGSVSVKDFYVRRILRIWPLYLAIVVIAFAIVPAISGNLFHPNEAAHIAQSKPFYGGALVLYLLMLPQMALQIFPRIACGAQCWSLGIEEQFYLFWPVIVKAFRNRPIMLCAVFLAGIIISRALLTLTGLWLIDNQIGLPFTAIQASALWVAGEFVFMWFGALAAVLFLLKEQTVSRLYHPIARISMVFLIGLYLIVPLPFAHLACGLLFALVVLTLTDPKLKLINSPALVYLGTISYGIYMFHPLVISLLMKPCSQLSIGVANVALYLAVLPLTVLISAISYKCLEQPFLKLKRRFTIVACDLQVESGINSLRRNNTKSQL